VALDVRELLLRLVYKHNFEQAFHITLSRCDLSIVSWLCSQVNLSHQQCAQTQQYVKIYFYFLFLVKELATISLTFEVFI
jgi:hypothetical protein